MTVEAVRYEGRDTSRLPSGSIWGRCPWAAIADGMVDGAVVWDDFTKINKTNPTTEGNWNDYAAFGSTAATIINGGDLGGSITMGAVAADEGVSFRTLIAPFKISQNALQKFWWEIRLRISTIADAQADVFVGLMEDTALTAIVPITAAGALADKNLCGFFRPESARTVAGTGGAIMNTTYKAAGVAAVVVQNDAVALVAGTYTKLGMKFEPAGDKDGPFRLSFYQDGTRLQTSKLIPSASGTDFPNHVNLGLVCAILNAAGGSPCTLTIDWLRAAQLYS